ncbi:MAG: DUF1127 domain-containing protein [Pseudomonadota bacterium]
MAYMRPTTLSAISIGGKRTVLHAIWSWLTAMPRLRRERLHLSRLTPDQLCDIGLKKSQAEAEARRASWDAPMYWHG